VGSWEKIFEGEGDGGTFCMRVSEAAVIHFFGTSHQMEEGDTFFVKGLQRRFPRGKSHV
jgi:hypothetical protein